MKKLFISGLVILALLVSLVGSMAVSANGGGTVTADKELSETDIGCSGSVDVTLTLVGQTGIAGDPEDIMLVLDRSGSMYGQPLSDLKSAANAFVDIIDEATDGNLDGMISNSSRVGVVSFEWNAHLDQSLTTDANSVKAAINALVAGGNTNHEAAIIMAQGQLASSMPNNTKQMIIFTDGKTTAGGNPDDDAAAARAAGTEIFCIGLGSVSVSSLNEWATDPDSEHVFIAPSSGDLQAIFEAIGAAITVPAATDIEVVDTVSDHFLVSDVACSKGDITVTDNVITWTIDELSTETVTLTYTATHDCTMPGGEEQVNDSVTYSDNEGHVVVFPNPVVNVHGCAALLELTPETDTNELGTPGQTHMVTATLTDDFGDPVQNINVDFEIVSGPNAGMVGSDITNASGEASFTYTATQYCVGLGQDTIVATVAAQCKVSIEMSDTAYKDWADTTPPDLSVIETVNPHGNTTPPAGSTTLPGPKGGMNEDGFYELLATDAVDLNPDIYVVDSVSGTAFGPFISGTKIKYTEDSYATPESKKIGSDKGKADAIDCHIIGNGDAYVYAVDCAGNISDEWALVPPPPK
ncbi:hypothetical protein ES703_17729 [subsurface metagenome]